MQKAVAGLIVLVWLVGCAVPSHAILKKMDPTQNGGNILIGALAAAAIIRLYGIGTYSAAEAINKLELQCKKNQPACVLSGNKANPAASGPGTDIYDLVKMKQQLDLQSGTAAKYLWVTQLLDLIFLMQDLFSDGTQPFETEASIRTKMNLGL